MPRTKLSKAELFEHFGNLLTSYDEQSQKRFTAIEDQASETKAELNRHKKYLETLKAYFARLAETVGVAAKAIPTKMTWQPSHGTLLPTPQCSTSTRTTTLQYQNKRRRMGSRSGSWTAAA